MMKLRARRREIETATSRLNDSYERERSKSDDDEISRHQHHFAQLCFNRESNLAGNNMRIFG